ncbi:hypothetical protein BH09ACT12_BH09ACT12_00010 [soil metagenome]
MNREFNSRQPFTRSDLERAGLEDNLVRRREYVALVKGVWIHRDARDYLSLIRAALLIHPADAFASHLSAAQVLGLPVPDSPFAHVTVSNQEDRHYRAQIKPHVTQRPRRVIVVDGIRTTDPIATFIDCAGWLSLVDRVVLGDALLKKYKITLAQLRRACDQSTDYYAGLARIAADYVREGVDSPMETRLRMLIVLAGLPEPDVNVITYREDGSWRRRFDLCYRAIKLIIEYEGRQHAEDSGQWNSDIDRREEFDDEGYRVLLVTSLGIYQQPERTLLRIRRQLILRGMPEVPRLDDRWREYFAA